MTTKRRGKSNPAQQHLGLPTTEVPKLKKLVDWYERNHVEHFKESSQGGVRSALRELLEHFGENAYPRPGDVREYFSERVDAGELMGSSANTKLRYISRMCFVARESLWPLLINFGHCERFPEQLKAPKALVDPYRTFPLCLAAMPDDTWKAFLCVQRWEGIRVSEACGLEPKHISFDGPNGPELRVEQQRNGFRGESFTTGLKADARPRTLQLDSESVHYLRAAMRARMTKGVKRFAVSRFLFPFSWRHLNPAMERLREVSPESFPRVKQGEQGGAAWHVFRHTRGKDLADAGTKDREVMLLMGHKTLAAAANYMQSIRGAEMPQEAQKQVHSYTERLRSEAAEKARASGVSSDDACNIGQKGSKPRKSRG